MVPLDTEIGLRRMVAYWKKSDSLLWTVFRSSCEYKRVFFQSLRISKAWEKFVQYQKKSFTIKHFNGHSFISSHFIIKVMSDKEGVLKKQKYWRLKRGRDNEIWKQDRDLRMRKRSGYKAPYLLPRNGYSFWRGIIENWLTAGLPGTGANVVYKTSDVMQWTARQLAWVASISS